LWALEIDGETLAGSGHFPHARDPARMNGVINQFADRFWR